MAKATVGSLRDKNDPVGRRAIPTFGETMEGLVP